MSTALGRAALEGYLKNVSQKENSNYSAVMSRFFGFYGVPETKVEWKMWTALDGMLKKVKKNPAHSPEELRWDRVCAEAADKLYDREGRTVKIWKPRLGRYIDRVPYDRGEEKSFRRLFEKACDEEGFTV